MSSGQDKRKTTATDADDDVAAVSTAGDGAARGTRPARGKPAAQGKDRDMGSALRSVYQHTVDEAVPDEMLDILGKLN